MKCAVVGSRSFSEYDLLEGTLNEFEIDEIISGGAKGADQLARTYAIENKITIREFRPEWKKYGRAAGPIRNKKIITAADIVIAFWDGKSKGTKSSINIAKKLQKELVVFRYDLPDKSIYRNGSLFSK